MIADGFAFRVENRTIKPIINFSTARLENLIGIDAQIKQLKINTEAFLSNKPFLDVLLWGERGCGKSSVVKALINHYREKGLKIIQIPTDEATFIYDIYELISAYKTSKFILFFDDISFDEQNDEYRKFKSSIEGGLEEKPTNAMIIATSNKRHLIKDEVLKTDSIYSADEISEQMSLYARFGLTISFRMPDKDTYLKIVEYYLKQYSLNKFPNWNKEALSFAISKGARSGRVAKQFVISKLLRL
ncbi:DUF815 domain-containing protein [Hippea alviniae]|uniref:DUF815 domain-containing protein n=1 Tax=Hippea alviniae TaxID=1279027 RepID=UPI0003B78F39|nr:DUF815 domain-containing protein [Hippea alviniae]